MKAINLLLVTIIIIVGINFYPKVDNYFHRLEIEKNNE